MQSVCLHPPALYWSLARFKTATFPLIDGSFWIYFLAVVKASNGSIRTLSGGKFGQFPLSNGGSWFLWKVESADAPGVAAMISGVRKMVFSATISSSSIFRRRRDNEGCGCCPDVALLRNLRIVFIDEQLASQIMWSKSHRKFRLGSLRTWNPRTCLLYFDLAA